MIPRVTPGDAVSWWRRRASLEEVARRWRAWVRFVLFDLSLTVLLLIVIGASVVFLLFGSFLSGPPGSGGGFSLDAYEQLYSERYVSIFANTLIVMIGGTVVAAVIAIATLLYNLKTDLPAGGFLAFVLISQYLVPSFVQAIAWDFYANPKNGFLNTVLLHLPLINEPPINIFGAWGIALVVGLHYSGLFYLLAAGAIRAVPAHLEEAANVNNASIAGVFRRITLPLALPSILIGVLIVLTRGAQTFSVPLILGVRGNVFVLSTLIYLATKQSVPAQFTFAAAIGVTLLFFTVGGLYVHRRLQGASDKYETVVGRGEGTMTKRYSITKYRRTISAVFIALFVILYVLPMISVLLSSFQTVVRGISLNPDVQWTLGNYHLLFFSGDVSAQFYTSLKNAGLVSGVGAFVTMLVSVMISYIIVKTDSVLSGMLDFLAFAPIAIPGIIFAAAYLWIFVTYDFLGLFGTIWLVMIVFGAKFLIYGTRAINSSLRSIGGELEEAARVCGAGLAGVMRRVIAPLIMPGFMAGYMILALDFMKSLSIPLLVGGGNPLIQTLIWDLQNVGEVGAVAALSVILTLIVGVLYLVTYLVLDADVVEL